MELLPSLLSWIDNAKRTIAQNFTDLATPRNEETNLEPGVVPRPRLFHKIDETSEDYRKRQEDTYWNEATNNMLGAGIFRPVRSVLPPDVIHYIKSEIPSIIPSGLNLLPKKSIADYGTENFPLDKYLLHSQDTNVGKYLREDLSANIIDNSSILDYEKKLAISLSKDFDSVMAENPETMLLFIPSMRDKTLSIEAKKLTPVRIRQLKQEYMQSMNSANQIKEARQHFSEFPDPIYTPSWELIDRDFDSAFRRILDPYKEADIPIDSLKGKSLESILKKREELVTKALLDKENYLSNLAEYSKKRNAEQGLPEGWVRLDTRQDRAMDTEILNHCVGSGTTDANGRFLPAVNPLTGKPNLSDAELKRFNQGENYYGPAVEGGFKTIYSYRPKGLPVVTIEMARYKGGYPRQKIIQVAGENNRNLSKDEFQQILPSFKNTLKKDGMQLDDINNIIEIYLNSR